MVNGGKSKEGRGGDKRGRDQDIPERERTAFIAVLLEGFVVALDKATIAFVSSIRTAGTI